MFGNSIKVQRPGPGPVIGLLAVLFLGAVAVAVPEAPFTIETDQARGVLVSHAEVGPQLAEQYAGSGYSYFAVDVTGAELGRHDLLAGYMKTTAQRGFSLFAWIDANIGAEAAQARLDLYGFAGLFLYGNQAGNVAESLRGDSRNAGLSIRVVHHRRKAPVDASCVAYPAQEFPGNGVEMPVLIAEQLGETDIDAARAKAKGGYLVARASLPALD